MEAGREMKLKSWLIARHLRPIREAALDQYLNTVVYEMYYYTSPRLRDVRVPLLADIAEGYKWKPVEK